MTELPLGRLPRLSWQQALSRNRRLLVSVGAFVAIFVYLDVLQPGAISYFEINFLSSNTGPLAFATARSPGVSCSLDRIFSASMPPWLRGDCDNRNCVSRRDGVPHPQ